MRARPRRLRRVLLALLTGLLLPVVLAAPALAVAPDDGEVASNLSLGMQLLLFVVIPFGFVGLVSLLVVLPGMLRRPRYRPGRAWAHDPLWFAGPADPDAALAGARAGSTAKGGTSAEW